VPRGRSSSAAESAVVAVKQHGLSDPPSLEASGSSVVNGVHCCLDSWHLMTGCNRLQIQVQGNFCFVPRGDQRTGGLRAISRLLSTAQGSAPSVR
jgi:hypothetical protein